MKKVKVVIEETFKGRAVFKSFSTPFTFFGPDLHRVFAGCLLPGPPASLFPSASSPAQHTA